MKMVEVTKKEIEMIRKIASQKKKSLGDAKQAAIVAFAKIVGQFLPECRLTIVA